MKKDFKPKIRYSASLKRKALTDYQSGKMTVCKIAKKYRVCPATLTVWAKRAKVPLRRRGRRRMAGPTSRQRAILGLAGIVNYDLIGKKFGITKQGVSRIVRRWRSVK